MDSDARPIQRLVASLKIKIDDLALLRQALVHRSYLNEHPESSLASNERLEFLGDAVLGLVIGESLVRDYPDLGEGELTRRRAALVRTETLAEAANELGLGKWLLLSKGESAGGGQQRESVIGDAFEAVIGAIYLDQGLESARKFAIEALDRHLKLDPAELGRKDPKSELQERVQRVDGSTPTYEVVRVSGPDHARSFAVAVRVGEQEMGMGEGASKRKAEQEAAKIALKKLEGDSE